LAKTFASTWELSGHLAHCSTILTGRQSEKYAARVFGAHRSYSGVVGTSNKLSIMQAHEEDDLVVSIAIATSR
jgi:arginine/lysine/ornithine decarboxylase